MLAIKRSSERGSGGTAVKSYTFAVGFASLWSRLISQKAAAKTTDIKVERGVTRCFQSLVLISLIGNEYNKSSFSIPFSHNSREPGARLHNTWRVSDHWSVVFTPPIDLCFCFMRAGNANGNVLFSWPLTTNFGCKWNL